MRNKLLITLTVFASMLAISTNSWMPSIAYSPTNHDYIPTSGQYPIQIISLYLPLAYNNLPSRVTSTPTPMATLTPTPGVNGTRPLKYYLVDRVIHNGDFSMLATWGINTAIVDFDVNGNPNDWNSAFNAAAQQGISIVIWPSDWNNPRPNCGWEAPYPITPNGDISKVKPLLDVASTHANFIGIVNAHESFWSCTNMTFDEMAGLKTQLKAYALSKGRQIKVWNYINSLYDPSMFPNNQISRVMDVAVTWRHCAGDAEAPCDTGKDSALAQIISDRARITDNHLDQVVDLVYIIQTFTYDAPYTARFTLTQLETYSCEFLKTNGLDGFGYYTWEAGWWPDMHSWPDLQPAIAYVHAPGNCH